MYVAREIERRDLAVTTWPGNPDLDLAVCSRRKGSVIAGRRWRVDEGTANFSQGQGWWTKVKWWNGDRAVAQVVIS